MPIDVEKDGKTITAYTQDELDAQLAEAAKKFDGYVPASDLEAEKNKAAASARKQAETEKATVEKELEKLRSQLDGAKGNTEKLAELNEKIATLETEKGAIAKRGKLALALLRNGLNSDYLEDALELKSFANLDPDDAKFAEQLGALKESKKLFFTTEIGGQEPQKKKASGGAGGSTNPSQSKYSMDDLRSMTKEQIAKMPLEELKAAMKG